jgi:hypothetical protein
VDVYLSVHRVMLHLKIDVVVNVAFIFAVTRLLQSFYTIVAITNMVLLNLCI